MKSSNEVEKDREREIDIVSTDKLCSTLDEIVAKCHTLSQQGQNRYISGVHCIREK